MSDFVKVPREATLKMIASARRTPGTSRGYEWEWDDKIVTDIWEAMIAAAPPPQPEPEQPPDLIVRAYMGLLVLRTVLSRATASGAGVDVTEELIADLTEAYPALPAIAALRSRP